MNFENIESTGEEMLSAFQNPSFLDMAGHDLMPKIRFTTDAAEASPAQRSSPLEQSEAVFYVEPKGDAVKPAFQAPSFLDMAEHDLMPKIRFTTDAAEASPAERSSPLEQPEVVFYVEPKGDAVKPESGAGEIRPSFQNESFGFDTIAFTHDTGAPSGDYVGPTPDALNLKIESDIEHLTFAQEQLALAIEQGTSVIQAMQNVENAQAILDAHMKQYNEAIKFRPPSGDAVSSKAPGEGDEVKLGASVSHAKWELEKAYERGSQADIDKAKRHMAEALAEEEAKKMTR